ncbi:hypothetical protein GCM10026982_48600 [Nocardiopsis aegyptia]
MTAETPAPIAPKATSWRAVSSDRTPIANNTPIAHVPISATTATEIFLFFRTYPMVPPYHDIRRHTHSVGRQGWEGGRYHRLSATPMNADKRHGGEYVIHRDEIQPWNECGNRAHA